MKIQNILVLIGILSFSTPAFAYIDPGMGSMLVQGLIGAFAVIGGAWVAIKQKLFNLFRSDKNEKRD